MFKSLFSEPFPESDSFGEIIRNLFFIGLFIAVFLYIFQPFGFSEAPEHLKLRIALMFGGVTFLVGGIYETLVKVVIRVQTDRSSWTLGRWLMHTITVVFLIALGNYALNGYLGATDFTWASFGEIVFATFAIGVFPSTLSGLLIQARHRKRNEQEAAKMQVSVKSHPDEIITIPSRTGEDLRVKAQDVLYLEAMENYVSIIIRNEGGEEKMMVRNTLQEIEQRLPIQFQRCHRSFILNLDRVAKIEGNAQGLRIGLSDTEQTVPVSRKFIPAFKEKVNS